MILTPWMRHARILPVPNHKTLISNGFWSQMHTVYLNCGQPNKHRCDIAFILGHCKECILVHELLDNIRHFNSMQVVWLHVVSTAWYNTSSWYASHLSFLILIFASDNSFYARNNSLLHIFKKKYFNVHFCDEGYLNYFEEALMYLFPLTFTVFIYSLLFSCYFCDKVLNLNDLRGT